MTYFTKIINLFLFGDLNAIAEKWGLKTKSTSFSVMEKPKSQVKRLKDIDEQR